MTKKVIASLIQKDSKILIAQRAKKIVCMVNGSSLGERSSR